MHRRIEVNPALPPIAIPGRLLNEICAHALETLPEECCGLLSGDGGLRFRQVFRCRNEMTALHRRDPALYPRDGQQAFYMNETDYLKAQKQAEERGETVTAVYHSHVGSGAYFSEVDQEFAASPLFPFPEADHIVVAVFERRVESLGVFQREPGGGAFQGRRLVPGAP